MKAFPPGLAEDYKDALQAYLSGGGKAALRKARDLGRRADEEGFGVVDMVWIHQRALDGLSRRPRGVLSKAAQVLAEAVSPFEMAHRDRRDANRDLEERARRLETEIEHRTKELLQAQERYRAMVEHIPAVTCVLSVKDTRVLYVSPQIEGLLGFPLSEWDADPERWRKQLHPEDAGRVGDEIALAAGRDAPLGTEYRMIARDGREVWVRHEAFVMGEGGNGRRVLQGILLDVTARKRMETALQEVHEELERRVAERTADLARANEELSAEVLERVRAEKEIRRNHALLTAIAEGTTDAVFVKDLRGRYLTVNSAGARMVGKTVEEVIGRDDSELFSPETARAIMKGDRRVMESGLTQTYEETGTAAGVTRIYLSTKGPYRDADGEVIGVVGISRDITELQKTTDALRESEERFRKVFEEGPIGMSIVGLDYRILRVNRAVCRMHGYTEEEFSRLTFPEITHPEDRDLDVEQARKLERGEIPTYSMEKRVRKKSGEWFWVRATRSVVHDREGQPLYFLVVIEDISARRAADAALRESEERNRAIVESASDAIITFSVDGVFQTLNPAFEAITGWSARDWLGRNWQPIVHPDDLPKAEQAFESAVRNEPPPTFELRILGKNGQYIVAEITSRSLVREGKVAGVLVAARDISERKRDEIAMRDNIENLKALFDAVFEGIIITEDGIVQDINKAVTDIMGYTREEMIGKPAVDFVGRLSKTTVGNHLRTQYGELYEGVGITKDGRQIVFEIVGKPYFYKGRQARVTTVRDISKRREAEQALRESEERNRAVVEAASEIIATRALDGTLTSLNPAFEMVTGFPREEWIGKPFASLYHPEDVPAAQEAFRMACRGEVPPTIELRLLTKAGRHAVVESTLRPMKRDGKVVGVMSVTRDISQRKRAEEALRRSEERFRQMAENVKEIFWLISPKADQILYVSPAFEDVWQRDREVLYRDPKSWVEAIHPEDRERVVRETETMQPFMPWTKEYRVVRPDGSIRWCRDQTFPIRDERGEIFRVAGITEDITERKRAEEERQRMSLELLRAQKLQAVGRLAAGIAHEINTPMQFIGDNTHFLRDAYARLLRLLDACARLHEAGKAGPVPAPLVRDVDAAVSDADLDFLREEIPRSVQQSLEGIEHIAKIVRAMKEFAHPIVEERVEADLNRIVESAITVSRNEWKYVADVVRDLAPDLPLVPCLAGEITQVLLNIIVNAAQAIAEVVGDGSKGKGTITVRTRRDGDYVEVRISDTGPGIPERYRENIFEPFFTTKEIGKGTGQGLATSRTVVVEKHLGSISFETETGKGTTFIIRLPLRGL